MSKWLRRGFGQNATTYQDENNEFPLPPRNTEMPSAAYASQQNPPPQQQPMVGYTSPSPASVAMDVDHQQDQRAKYSQPQQYQPPNGMSSNKPYDRTSRSVRPKEGEDVLDGHRTRQSRPSSRGSTRSRPQQPPQPTAGTMPYQYQPRPVTTSAAAAMAPQTQHYAAPQAPMPHPQYHQHKSSSQMGTATPPPESMQPSFPPPAVTSDSPTQPEPSQRRPAYLLHRDLVIGKGSYGQVCIASRGEAEGHSSGRSGKRKKFACKCVMLRNDPKYIAKLQEEVNVLRELRGHQNVIRLYDVFCVDNELFIITELGRGGDLFHLLTTHPKHGVTESYAGTLIAIGRGYLSC